MKSSHPDISRTGRLEGGGEARREQTGRNADKWVRAGHNRPICLPVHRRRLSWLLSRKPEQAKSNINRWKNKIRVLLSLLATMAALRSRRLTHMLTAILILNLYHTKRVREKRWRNQTRDGWAVSKRWTFDSWLRRRPIFVSGCWPLHRRLLVSVKPFRCKVSPRRKRSDMPNMKKNIETKNMAVHYSAVSNEEMPSSITNWMNLSITPLDWGLFGVLVRCSIISFDAALFSSRALSLEIKLIFSEFTLGRPWWATAELPPPPPPPRFVTERQHSQPPGWPCSQHSAEQEGSGPLPSQPSRNKMHSEPFWQLAGTLLKCLQMRLPLPLPFSFALALSLLGSCSCRLRLGLGPRLRLRFRLGLCDDLGVVAMRTRAPSSARLAVADGEAQGLLLLGVRHHIRLAALVDLGPSSEPRIYCKSTACLILQRFI